MVLPMDKRNFLLSEHQRLCASGQEFWHEWRFDNQVFVADLLDMTPAWTGSRFLAPKQKELGIVPGNVEWHFKKHEVKQSVASKPSARATKKKPSRKVLSTTEKKKLANAAKDERRRKLAEEFRRWEEVRRSTHPDDALLASKRTTFQQQTIGQFRKPDLAAKKADQITDHYELRRAKLG